MVTNLVQTDFKFGEVSPSMFGRVDEKFYRLGLAVCRNFFVDYRSGVSTRSGTKYIAAAFDSTAFLVPFQRTATDGYILEFANGAIQFFKNGVIVAGIGNPFTPAEFSTLRFAQRENTITITHINHPPYILTWINDATWTLVSITFGATLLAPGALGIAITAPIARAGVTVTFRYAVSAVDINGQEGPIVEAVASLVNTDLFSISVQLGWASVTGAISYNVYKIAPTYNNPFVSLPAYGYMGSSTGTTTFDSYSQTQMQIEPNYAITPPIQVTGPFGTAGNPAACAFWQQRAVFGGTGGETQTFYMSIPGTYTNFNYSNPAKPDDAIIARLISFLKCSIKYFLSMPKGLLIFTDVGVWKFTGDAVNNNADPQAYSGIGNLPPIPINKNILYIQAKNNIVRDLNYNFYADIYTGQDISIHSNHLFFGQSLLQWSYAEEPFKVVWCVRADGVALSLTYVKENDIEIIGWGRHDTLNGTFKSVASVTEGTVDATYFVVQRTINGSTVYYIERLVDRFLGAGILDSWSVDAGGQYNGAPTVIIGGISWLLNTPVSVVADGVSIPNITVNGVGNLQIPTPASRITYGLPITAQLQTLPLDAGEPTIQGKRKKLGGLTVKVRETKGLKIGRTFSTLVLIKETFAPNLYSSTALNTGNEWVIPDPYYDQYGQICIQQDQPFPATILSIIPSVIVGDNAK